MINRCVTLTTSRPLIKGQRLLKRFQSSWVGDRNIYIRPLNGCYQALLYLGDRNS